MSAASCGWHELGHDPGKRVASAQLDDAVHAVPDVAQKVKAYWSAGKRGLD